MTLQTSFEGYRSVFGSAACRPTDGRPTLRPRIASALNPRSKWSRCQPAVRLIWITLLLQIAVSAFAATEIHVAKSGNDANPGTSAMPLATISAAARRAQPGDIVTVHAGTYRERVTPPRGGTSDSRRITYQAAEGEKVVITGSERARGWRHTSGDTWKLTLPNTYFGSYNPYADFIHGDWFSGNGRSHHTGCVYLNGDWLMEAAKLSDILKPVDRSPGWCAVVDGAPDEPAGYLLNIAWLVIGNGARIPADRTSGNLGTLVANCSEGGKCLGYIESGNWVRYDGVDFGDGTAHVDLRVAAAQGTGGIVQLRLGSPAGRLIGTCEVAPTGDWQAWRTLTLPIERTKGVQNLCLRFEPKPKPPLTEVKPGCTEIYAQFPGVDPNRAQVEINVRPTVFTPERVGVDYITVRGFDLRNVATNWAPPSAAQYGIVSAYWCKGWIIENNEISYSKCCGIALGKYGDEFDNTNLAGGADPYTDCVRRALKHGWNKDRVGSHIVRNNHIHHCEQTGIVGSLGCAFSRIVGNYIHDIHVRGLFGGAEMAGIKFHGAIDVVISENHIYRCGDVAGIWLDWMAQNAQVVGNLMHDNTGGCGDIFLEMQHGPILIANNLLLSTSASVSLNAQGVAFAHNLISGAIANFRGDGRTTPFQRSHSTTFAGLYNATAGDSGDLRFFNNVVCGARGLKAIDNSALTCVSKGNVLTKSAETSKFDIDALEQPGFDLGIELTKQVDGWYLSLSEQKSWSHVRNHDLVTTSLLGTARVSACRFDNPDGSPLRLDTDYFGVRRSAKNPFPGPFECSKNGRQTYKVWPLQDTRRSGSRPQASQQSKAR